MYCLFVDEGAGSFVAEQKFTHKILSDLKWVLVIVSFQEIFYKGFAVLNKYKDN